jgi:hypothetical protein
MTTRLFLFVSMLLCQGCGTLLQPGPDHVKVTSDPSGATVKRAGRIEGVTPLTVELTRTASMDAKLTLSKDGYTSQEVPMRYVVNGPIFLDILFWPVVFVDMATASMYKYSTRPVHVVLTASRPAPSPAVGTK